MPKSQCEQTYFFYLGVVGGIFITIAAVSLCLFAIGIPAVTPQTVKDWQTLIAGGLALSGALITVIAILFQVRQSEKNTNFQLEHVTEQSEVSRRRRNNASRAKLPEELSKVVRYAEACVIWLKAVRGGPGGDQFRQVVPPPNLRPLPAVSSTVVAVLSDCIESADPIPAEIMFGLVSLMQVQRSRLSGVDVDLRAPEAGGDISVANIDVYLINTLECLERANLLFEYARGESEIPPTEITPSELEIRANFREMYEIDYPEMHALIGRRYPKLLVNRAVIDP